MRGEQILFETLDRRTLFAVTTGSISGFSFIDTNQNGIRDPGENHPPYTHVYLDKNLNGRHDSGEPISAKSILDKVGQFRFTDLPAGTYRVAYDPLLGFTSEQAGGYNVTIHGRQSRRRVIPVLAPGTIAGK